MSHYKHDSVSFFDTENYRNLKNSEVLLKNQNETRLVLLLEHPLMMIMITMRVKSKLIKKRRKRAPKMKRLLKEYYHVTGVFHSPKLEDHKIQMITDL